MLKVKIFSLEDFVRKHNYFIDELGWLVVIVWIFTTMFLSVWVSKVTNQSRYGYWGMLVYMVLSGLFYASVMRTKWVLEEYVRVSGDIPLDVRSLKYTGSSYAVAYVENEKLCHIDYYKEVIIDDSLDSVEARAGIFANDLGKTYTEIISIKAPARLVG